MKESSNNSSQENVIARSESGRTLNVVQPGEKQELSFEKKAEIPEQIKKAEEKYQEEIDRIEQKYIDSMKENRNPGTGIEEKIKTIGLQRAKESYDSKVNFLNSLK